MCALKAVGPLLALVSVFLIDLDSFDWLSVRLLQSRGVEWSGVGVGWGGV